MKIQIFTALAAVLACSSPAEHSLDTNLLQRVTGLSGKMNLQEGVFKVGSPRNDVKIAVDGWSMPPFMGLSSWAAFKPGMKEEAMVMGDLVLFQDEVNPAMSAALANGLEVTALHNHFLFDQPKVFFMHIAGEGSQAKLAEGVRKVLDSVKEIRAANPEPASQFGGQALPAQSSIGAQPLEDIFGAKGESNNGMVKFVFGRTAKMACGCDVGKEMGINTWAAFAGAEDNAVVDGDFAVLEVELQSVLKSLRHSGMNIVAIHQHMTQENPRLIFLHYWGRGKASDLARKVKLARGEQSKAAAAAARLQGGFKEASVADYEKSRKNRKAIVLDVRSAQEFATGHVPGAINIDINAPGFAEKAAQFDKSRPILVNCHAGSRGDVASAELSKLGFKTVCNLEGGLQAWEKAGNQVEK